MLGYTKAQWLWLIRSKHMFWIITLSFCFCGWAGMASSPDAPPAQIPAKLQRMPAVVQTPVPSPTPVPSTAPTKTTTKPVPPRTTTTKSLPVVHPGAFCSPRGARGVTSSGTSMVCINSATDTRNRWRAA